MARIGLLSDSHGRADTTRRAVQTLLSLQVDLILHLGDVGSPEVIDQLLVAAPSSSDPLPVHIVFGNIDGNAQTLARYSRHLGIIVDHPVGRLEIDGKELIFTHGDNAQLMADAVRRGATWLCHGHTHRAADEHRGKTRVINPGALYRAASYSVAVLDTTTDELEFRAVPSP